MQRSTLYSFFSVLAASILLVGPYSAIHTVWNFGEAIGRLGQRERLNTKAATRQRVEMCESTADVYTSFVAATGGLISGGAPGTPPAIADSSRIQPPTSISTSVPSDFMRDEYKSAAEEIRARIGQEEILFGLKLTLIGAIMAVLFSLFKSEEKDYFEKLVQKRRAAAFFSAALLTSVIVDTRLRFNAKIIESLGNWVWCIERKYVTLGGPDRMVPWEGFLHFQLDGGANPLLRYSSHLLTSLLYGVTLYLFIVMPRTINRSTRAMLIHTGTLFFVLLICISISYDCPYGRRWALWGSAATVLIAMAGLCCLREAYRERFVTSNACRLTDKIVENMERRLSDGGHTAKEQAAFLRDKYEVASRLLEPHLFMLRLSNYDQAEMEHRLKGMEIPRNKSRTAVRMVSRWKRVKDRKKRLAEVRRRGKWQKVFARRHWLSIQARYFEWKIARSLRPPNVEAAHAAEEVLWDLYFDDFTQRHSVLPRNRTD